MDSKEQQIDITATDSFSRNAIRMFIFLLITMLFQTGFNLVDMMFVGKMGAEALAAISLVFPVIFFLITLGLSIGSGISSCVARAIGARNTDRASTIASNGIVL